MLQAAINLTSRPLAENPCPGTGRPPVTRIDGPYQRGFVLLPVVLAILLIATTAFLLNTESAINVEMMAGTTEARRADYVAQAALAHATWAVQNSNCAGDMSMTTVPFGTHSYSATVNAPGAGSSTTYTVSVDQDAWIKESSPSENHGSDSELSVKNASGDDMRALYRFDLSSIPVGSRLASATAWFYVAANDDQGLVNLHKISAGWAEGGATWSTMASNYDGQIIGSVPTQPSSDVWVQVNLTSLVQQWVNGATPNDGIMLLGSSDAVESKYTGKEWGTASQRPWMEVVTLSDDASPVTIDVTGTLANGVTRTLTRIDVPAYQPGSYKRLQPGAASGKDAEIWDQAPNNNYGNSAETWVSSASNDTTRTLLRFNMGEIPVGARILAATLSLDRESGSGADQPVSAHRIGNAWSEDSVTWNIRETGTNWDTAGGDFDNAAVATTPVGPANQRYEWNIAPLVQGWVDGSYPNYGVALTAAIAGMAGERFRTSDHADPSLWPSLSITYACECGSACIAPQGSGNVLMPASSSSNPTPEEVLRIELLESWGYVVDPYWQKNSQSNYNSKMAHYDVVYVPATSNANDIGTKLTNAPIGVVYELGALNDELGIATSSASPVGSTINISDNSHYITLPFASGPLNIYSAAMQGVAVAGTPAPGLQTLGDWSGAGGPVVLDKGMPLAGGGTAAGRRVLLPMGGSNLDLAHVNNNGRLIMQRALQWGTGNIAPVVSDPIILSTDSAATLGGLTFDDIDLAEYDPAGDSATLFFEGALTTLGSDIDALHVLANDHILVSTKDAATLGGLSFADGDLVDYDPATDTATLYFDESAFSADEDIKSVYLMDNGHIVLSTDSDATLGTLSFTDNDLVEYDPGSGTATLYFDGSTTTLTSEIDAVHLLANGHIVLSTKDDASLGGMSFTDGDLVDYDPATDTAVLYFDEGLFAGDEEVISAHIGPGSGGDSAPGPIAHWKLDEGSGPTAFDSIGGNNATLNGDATWTIGTLDGALEFDGSSDYVITDSNFTPPPIGTVTFWMQVSGSPASHGRILGLHDEWEIRHVTTGTPDGIPYGLVFDLGVNGVNTEFATTTTIDTPGRWYHIAASYDTTNDAYAVYIDGVPHKSGTYPASLAVPGANLLSIGTRTGSTNYFDGVLDDVRIYDQFLSASEIADLAGGSDTYTVLMVVADPSSLTPAADDRKALMESWGYTVNLIDDNDSQANFDAGVAATDVVYVGSGSVGANIGTKLDAATKGVVNEPISMASILGFASSWVPVLSVDQLTIVDSTHSITQGFASPVAVFTSPLVPAALSGTLSPDLQNLADAVGAPALAVLESGATTHDAGTTSGRRAQLPFAGAGTGGLTADGQLMVRRAIEWSATPGGGGGGGGGGCDGTFRDEFNARSYSGSDGTLAWATDWLEVNESNGPTSGDEQVLNDESNYQLRVQDNDSGGEGVEREADLSAYAGATLSFDYRRSGLDNSNDHVTVEVSSNGGGSWTELDRFQGSATDSNYQSVSYDISTHIAPDTRIRFLSSSNLGNNDRVYFDDVEICATN